MISNLEEALEQNKRLVNETFFVTQELEYEIFYLVYFSQNHMVFNFHSRKSKADLIVLKNKMKSQQPPGSPFFRYDRKCKTILSKPVTYEHFRNVNGIIPEEFVEKLNATEAALRNSEELNFKLVRGRKELERNLQEMEKQLRNTTASLSAIQVALRSKEEECAGYKSKLALFENKDGTKQIVDEMRAQLMEKQAVTQVAWEETKITKGLLNDAVNMIHKLQEERGLILDQAQKFQLNQAQQKSSMQEEIQQIVLENKKLAEVVLQHEKVKNQLQQ